MAFLNRMNELPAHERVGKPWGGSVGCEVALNGWVQAGKECQGSTVTLGDQKLTCNDPNGWVLSDPRHIELKGSACDRLMRGGSGALKVEFPCGVFRVD